MDKITKIVIEDFEKKPDGSWVVIQKFRYNYKSGEP